MPCKQDSIPNVVTPKEYKALKNPDGVNRLYSFHLLVRLIVQFLYLACKDITLVLHEQPIGIGVVGFHFFLQNCCERCSRMRTTTPNESFNAKAWNRSPKHLLVTKNTVSTVVLEYNKGVKGGGGLRYFKKHS